MKTILLFLSLSLSLLVSSGQSHKEYQYVSILNPGAIWSELYISPEPGYPDTTIIPSSYERFTITGEDTIINEIAYKKLYMFYDSVFNQSKAMVIGGIREDENKKVYYKGKTIHPLKPSDLIIYNGGNEGDEILLYDFGIQIGDTLKIDNLTLPDEIITVASIDTVLIGNTYRKEFSFNFGDYLYPGLKWIEGIGSIKGLIFTSGDTPTNGLHNDLICFKQDNQTLYLNNSYPGCFPDLTSDLSVDAGSDVMVCYPYNPEDRIQLTGVASGGVEPYTYTWSGKQIKYISPDDSIWVYASHFLNDTTISNPSFKSIDAPENWVTFYLKVKDAAGNTAIDSVKIIEASISTTLVYYPPVTIQQGDSIKLWGILNQFRSNFPLEYTLFPTTGLSDPKDLHGWAKPDTSTTYNLLVESAAGCVEKFYYRRIEVLPTSSSNHTSAGKAVQCYWNQGELVIQVPPLQRLPFEVSITTTNGSLIHKGTYSQREIRLGNLHLKKSQVYIVSIGEGKDKQVVKVMGN